MKTTRWLFLWLIMLVPHILSAQEPARPTLLLQFDQIAQKDLDKALTVFSGTSRDPLISYLHQRAFMSATEAEANLLRERGFHFTVEMRDTSEKNLYKRAVFGPAMVMPAAYHTYRRILAEVDSLAGSAPRIVRSIPIGKTTQEGRTIIAVKISNDVTKSQDKPRILFDGCHHADEVMGAEICMRLVHELVEQYGHDSLWTDAVDRFEIFVVPVVNVDGHTVVTSGIDPRWRKNTHDTNGNGILYEYPEGVDVNRNYDFNWAQGGSDDPASERYRGEFPFSEAENRAMAGLAMRERFLLSITYHSQGEVIYFPWDWRGRKAPEDRLLADIGNGLAASITCMSGDTCYKAEYGAGTVGQSYPWLYGKCGTFDFVIETGRGAHIFPEEDIETIVRANLEGVKYILHRAKGPGLTGHVVDAVTRKPLEATVWFPATDTEELTRRTSDPVTGRFWRLLQPAKHRVTIMHEGYEPRVFPAVEIGKEGWTTLEVALRPVQSPRGVK